MRGLLLNSINCTHEMWKEIDSYLHDCELVKLEYPKEVTMVAKHIHDISQGIAPLVANDVFDFVIGHGIGGIVALQLIKEKQLQAHKVILTETNLVLAGQYYRNLFYREPKNVDWFFTMMQQEEPYYRDDFVHELQGVFDYQDLVREISQPIYGIYGDRGQDHYVNRIEDLHMAADVNSMIHFRFIPECGYLPMLENPAAYYACIHHILQDPE